MLVIPIGDHTSPDQKRQRSATVAQTEIKDHAPQAPTQTDDVPPTKGASERGGPKQQHHDDSIDGDSIARDEINTLLLELEEDKKSVAQDEIRDMLISLSTLSEDDLQDSSIG